MSKLCACSAHADEPFDAETAFTNLARKQEAIATVIARYMSEASLAGPQRVANALTMSEAITSTIFGGLAAPDGMNPECCLVGQVDAQGRYAWYCAGVLIHRRAVITAAHCIRPDLNRVPNVVALDRRSIHSHAGEEIRIQGVPIIHPLYQTYGRAHDVAVLILRRESTVTPADLATPAETHAARNIRVVGFGHTDRMGTTGFGVKRYVGVTIDLLRRSASEDFNQAEGDHNFESDSEFVAGLNDIGDACEKDSGGPAYIAGNGAPKVVGLVARAVGSATERCGSGGVYTRIDTHAQFIDRTLRAIV